MWLRPKRVVLQLDSDDCAPAALASICQYHGVRTSIGRLRQLVNVRGGKATLLDLVDAAQAIGFKTKGFRADWSGLTKLEMPAIVHWETTHFVVIWEIDAAKNRLLVGDPAVGDEWLDREQFERKWHGVVATFAPEHLVVDKSIIPSFRLMRDLLKGQLQGYRLALSIFLVSGTLALIGLILPTFVRWVIDDLGGTVKAPLSLSVLLYIVCISIILQATLVMIREYAAGIAVVQLSQNMSLQYVDKLLRARMMELEGWRIGDLFTRFSDIGQIQGIYIKFLIDTSFGLLLLIGTGVFTAWRTGPFLWLLALPLPVMVFSILVLHPRLRMNERLVLNLSGSLQSFLISALSGLRSIKTYRASPAVRGITTAQLDTLLDAQFRGQLLRGATGTLAALVPGFGQVLVLMIGSEYVRRGQMTVGDLVAVSTLLTLYFSAWNSAMDMAARLQEASSAAQRLNEIYCLPELATTGECAANLTAAITLDTVSLDRGATRILQEISLTLRPGQITVIVGPPGSGKSTLLSLIGALYPPSDGAVLWDGVPYHSMQSDSIYSQLALVPQDTQLLAATVFDNVVMGEDATPESIATALHLAGALEWVQRLPNGIYTVVGNETSYRLSAGQQQMIQWARALVRNPSVFLFDEPTSAVDRESTERFIKLVQYLRGQERLVCVVTHDPAVAAAADMVVTLHHGRIKDIQRRGSSRHMPR